MEVKSFVLCMFAYVWVDVYVCTHVEAMMSTSGDIHQELSNLSYDISSTTGM